MKALALKLVATAGILALGFLLAHRGDWFLFVALMVPLIVINVLRII